MNTCACGVEFKPRNKAHKRCASCQAITHLSYRIMRVTCPACGQGFYPTKPGHRICCRCLDGRSDPTKYPVPCVRCGEHRRIANGLETTCLPCVQSSKDMVEAYLATLLRTRNARQAP